MRAPHGGSDQGQIVERGLRLSGYYSFILIGWGSVVIPSLIRSIQHDFGQSDAAFGFLYLVKSIMYATGALAGGMLTERLGRKPVLLASSALSVITFIALGLAPTWALFVLINAPLSLGGGAIDGGVNALFLDLFRDARGSALNFLHVFFSLGAFVGPFAIGLMISAGVPWRVLILITGVAYVPLLLALWRLSMPAGHRERVRTHVGEVLAASERSLLPFCALAIGLALYTAGEIGVSNWVVRLLADTPVALATAILSGFWAGLTAGRLASRWLAERFDYTVFTVSCILLASVALAGAVVLPWLPVRALLFALTGFFYAPVYPMIFALGGNIYPHRLSSLSGNLTTAGGAGVMVYPPLMGLMAASVGLEGGMLGAAALGLPCAIAIFFARRLSLRSP